MIIAGKRGLYFGATHYTPGQEIPGAALEALGKPELARLRDAGLLRKVSDDPDEEAAEPLKQHGRWNMSPESLKGKDLKKLNALLIERGADPVASVKVAKKILTADYDPDIDAPGPSMSDG